MKKRGLPRYWSNRFHRHRRIFALLLASGVLDRARIAQGQFDNFEPSVEPCPSDSSISGYTSITTVNRDIDQEINRISDGGLPQEQYSLTLCPGTFDTAASPLLPRLNQASFSCAAMGNVNDGCIFSGGGTNIRIEDPLIDGYNINAITFLGITFTSFTNYSIELLGTAPTKAIFLNCLWEDFQSVGIARIANDVNPPMDMLLDMCSIRSSTEQTTDAVVEIGFENNGGSMMLDSVLIEGIQITNTMFRTVENGATIVFDSIFQGNSLSRLSDVMSGMAVFTRITISNNVELQRMFEVFGDGSSTVIEDTVIERNSGVMAYQIFRVVDGAEGKLLNSTIRLNNPVEYGMYVLVETEGTTPMGTIEDSVFQENTQEDWALVMSEGDGAFVDMSRNQFIQNTGGIMNIGAFFGGDIRFVSTCFVRNNHFLVALILEFSEFEAFDNYVEDEISQVCSGMDAMQGPGRLSVEQPGSMCFRGGENCMVDCLPNANDSPICLADTQIISPMPTSSAVEPSLSPSPTRIGSPSSSPTNLDPPTATPTVMQSVVDPTNAPSQVTTLTPVTAFPTKAPIGMPGQLTTLPTFPPLLPLPTRPPNRPPKPTVRPTTYFPPHHCHQKGKSKTYGYYGIGDCNDSDYAMNNQESHNQGPFHSEQSNKKPKNSTSGSHKNEKESKGSKKGKNPSGRPPSSNNSNIVNHHQQHPSPPEHYGIGASEFYSSSGHFEKSQFGIGYTYAQPRTTASATRPTNTTDEDHISGETQKWDKTPIGEGRGDTTSSTAGEVQFHGIGHTTSTERVNGEENSQQ
ncbi:hypothetical protein IV203_030133 [Nitzschia inconspicua]|uniref:Pectin lyase-like protein n=1 Tax=Nitzschia inconspicua TaxID=303405 RepID=A0A9K3LSQ7_9STRA|nr:hypothetical protein IV203_030133 [Nitzschia inconspicua]